MIIYRILCGCLLWGNMAYSQGITIQGRVVQHKENLPLKGASIFINNSSVGTLSNDSGFFSIRLAQPTTNDLIISYSGFQTVTINLASVEKDIRYRIEMEPKPTELQEVVVGSIEVSGWDKWGNLFLTTFMGTSDIAKKCKLLNHETIKFRFNKKKNLLRAFADEPLQLYNKVLGYNVKYQLEDFEYDFNQRRVMYAGYALFDTLEGGAKKVRNWAEEREKAYQGSLLHFIRSLYAGKTREEGFELRSLIRLRKGDSLYAQLIVRKKDSLPHAIVVNRKFGMDRNGRIKEDSTMKMIDYHHELDTTHALFSNFKLLPYRADLANEILPQSLELLSIHPIAPESIVFIDSVNKMQQLLFDDFIEVKFLHKTAEEEYVRQNNIPTSPAYPVSVINLVNRQGVLIYPDGLFYNPIDLLTEKYWGWQKVAETLPLDYQPAK